MLKIEFIPSKENDDASKVIVNGFLDGESLCFDEEDKSAYFKDEKVAEILLGYSFKEIAHHFCQISYSLTPEWWDDGVFIVVTCKEYSSTPFPSIRIYLKSDWLNWAKAWSISSFAKELEKTINSLEDSKISYVQESDYSVLDGFGISIKVDNVDTIVETIIEEAIPILSNAINITTKRLIASLDKESLLTYFQFPETIKTACKQYLIYFAQFIADIGISVDTEIKEEAGQTLFKIVPQEREQALNKIKEALDIYLNAPNIPDLFLVGNSSNDISVKQWEANIYHLKSQLLLSNSVLQANQATIESLQLSNYQYRQLLESKNLGSPNKEGELIDGILAVKKYEGKFFSINFAEIIRKLKRKLSK